MKITEFLNEKFIVIIELHPLKHKKSDPTGLKSGSMSIVDKAEYLRPYADIITVTESTHERYSHTTLETVKAIRERAKVPVLPHLTLRGFTPDNAEELVEECRQDNLNNLFIIRGDGFNAGEGTYTYSSDMVSHLLEINPELSVGAACNPHGDREKELVSIQAKVRAGATYLISQPVFSVEEYLSYVEWLKDNGTTVPVIAGIIPLRSRGAIDFVDRNIPEIVIPEDVKEEHLAAENIRAHCLEFNRKLIQDLKEAGAPGIDLFCNGNVCMAEDLLRGLRDS